MSLETLTSPSCNSACTAACACPHAPPTTPPNANVTPPGPHRSHAFRSNRGTPHHPILRRGNVLLSRLPGLPGVPAGVDYATLFETARADIEESKITAAPTRSLYRFLTLDLLFTRPRLLRIFGKALRLYQTSGAESLFRKLHLQEQNSCPPISAASNPRRPASRKNFPTRSSTQSNLLWSADGLPPLWGWRACPLRCGATSRRIHPQASAP